MQKPTYRIVPRNEGRVLDVGEDKPHALAREAPRQREPDAAGRAGDDRHFALKLLHDSSSLVRA